MLIFAETVFDMTHLIDSEKLIAEIEERIALLKGVNSKGDYAKGSIDADMGILEYITSLQQEQPECIYGRSLKEREKYCKVCSAVCKVRVQQEQPHWKPSDEQLRPLEYAIDYFKKKRNDTTYLESLYNDLQKLL